MVSDRTDKTLWRIQTVIAYYRAEIAALEQGEDGTAQPALAVLRWSLAVNEQALHARLNLGRDRMNPASADLRPGPGLDGDASHDTGNAWEKGRMKTRYLSAGEKRDVAQTATAFLKVQHPDCLITVEVEDETDPHGVPRYTFQLKPSGQRL